MGILQLLNDLLALAKGINNLELNKKLMELQRELMQLQDENRTLTDRVLELASQGKDSEETFFADDAYWKRNGKEIDGPFCCGCFDSDSRLIRLTKMEEAFRAFGTHRCPVCKNHSSPKKPV